MNNLQNPYLSKAWPNYPQKLLLTAALFEKEKAANALKKWYKITKMENLDIGSVRLLPLLYHNLKRNNIYLNNKLTDYLEGVYLSTLKKNEILFEQSFKIIDILQIYKTPFCFMKGFVLNLLHYDNYALRPMSDIDILVDYNKRFEVIELLIKHGWKTSHLLSEVVSSVHAINFVNMENYNLDLHWCVFHELDLDNLDQNIWSNAIEQNFKDRTIHLMNHSDLLFHVCKHAFHATNISTIRWIADAITILNNPKAKIDWQYILQQMQKRNFTSFFKDSFNYLKIAFLAPIPDSFLSELNRICVSKVEKLRYKNKIIMGHAKLPRNLSGLLKLGWDDLCWQISLAKNHKKWNVLNYFNPRFYYKYLSSLARIYSWLKLPLKTFPLSIFSHKKLFIDRCLYPDVINRSIFFNIIVRVKNKSYHYINSYPPAPFHLAFHWISIEDNKNNIYEGTRTSLYPHLSPKSFLFYEMNILAPSVPGYYHLHVALVQEGVRWLDWPENSFHTNKPILIL